MDHQWEPGLLARASADPLDAPAASPRSSRDAGVRKPGTASILIVEDQEDVRRMLATALAIEGHRVEEAANAVEGLQRLKERRFHLVLSDYAMPGRTGTWMLREAGKLGLLDRMAAVIVTAHPEVQRIPGIEVIAKPLDLDSFLAQVRRLVGAVLAHESAPPSVLPTKAQPVRLVLYVSSASAASVQARGTVERVLERYDAAHVTLTVCDLVRDPLAGDADHIVFTPTLVRRSPGPRVWLLGSIPEDRVVAELLRSCGVEPRGEASRPGVV